MTVDLGRLKKEALYTLLVVFFYSLGTTLMVTETDFLTRFYNNLLSFAVFGGAVLITTKLIARRRRQ